MNNNDGSFYNSVTDIGISVYQHKNIEETVVVYMINIPTLEDTYITVLISMKKIKEQTVMVTFMIQCSYHGENIFCSYNIDKKSME